MRKLTMSMCASKDYAMGYNQAIDDMPQWTRLEDGLPEEGEEVLVLVDGHRGPSWCNTYQLVAHLFRGKFWEERHPEEPVEGVFAWQDLPDRIFK